MNEKEIQFKVAVRHIHHSVASVKLQIVTIKTTHPENTSCVSLRKRNPVVDECVCFVVPARRHITDQGGQVKCK